jgi:hypothetical protein
LVWPGNGVLLCRLHTWQVSLWLLQRLWSRLCCVCSVVVSGLCCVAGLESGLGSVVQASALDEWTQARVTVAHCSVCAFSVVSTLSCTSSHTRPPAGLFCGIRMSQEPNDGEGRTNHEGTLEGPMVGTANVYVHAYLCTWVCQSEYA